MYDYLRSADILYTTYANVFRKVVEVKVRDVLIKSGRVPTKSEVCSLASHDAPMSHGALINQFLSHEILHLL